MLKCLTKRITYTILLSTFMAGTFSVPANCMVGSGLIVGLKRLGAAIIKDLKNNPLPLFRIAGSKIATLHAVFFAIIPLLFMAYTEIISGSFRDTLTSNAKDRNYFCTPNLGLFLLPEGINAMARKIGLNPEHVIVHKSSNKNTTAGATQSFTRNFLIVGKPMINEIDAGDCSAARFASADHEPHLELNDDERRFSIGHEFAHLAHAHPIKIFAAGSPFALASHIAIVAGKTAIGLSLLACTQGFQLPTHGALSVIAPLLGQTTQFLLQNKWIEFIMESLLSIKLDLRYIRNCEKQADIESAVTFNCAAHGISFFEKLDVFLRRKYSPLKYFLHGLIDLHPTCAERIAYLRPIAQAQEEVRKKAQ